LYRILYVDDEPGLLEIGKLFLEQSGQFSVDVITSAPAALALLNTKNYDAIISDYLMPGMDGIEFLKTVRTSGNTLPFILFTGRGREEVVIQALNEGADFYLQKGGNPSALFAELTHKILSAVEHHRSVERIKSLNRLYSVLSATNKAIVKISTKEKFFSEICRILVETGGFCMAWIGLADPEHEAIRPAASAGQTGDYLDHISISTEDVPLGRGPTGTAYRQGSCYFSNDITRDPNMEPWRESALNHGYRANAALPFSLGTKNAGVLSLYAPVSGFFDDEIISLLKELADAISFALRTIDEKTERESSDAALRESEERFRTLYINMTEGAALHEIVYTDKGTPDDYIILETNPAFEKQLALSRTAVIGKTSREAYGVARPPYLDIYSDVALTGMPVAFETYFAPMDKYFSISVYSLKKGRFATIFDDITERKKAEHELQEKTAELEDYFSKSLYLSCIADTDGYFRRLNPEWEKTLGYTLADLVGSRFLDLVHPDDQPRTLAVMGDLHNKKNVLDFTNRFRHKDGSYRWIEWRSYPNPKNNLIFATARDITRQKETEETLQNVNDLLKGVIESPAGVVIFALDRQYHYIAFNENHRRTMKQIWGADIALGTSMLAYIQDPGDRAKATLNFNRALAGESFTVTEAYGDTNLERRWYENAYNPITDKKGNITGLTLFLTDITERKKAEESLRQNKEKYQSIIETLPDAVSVIDKDFKVTFANANLLSWLHGMGQNNDIIGRMLLDAFPFLSSTVLDEYRTVFLKGKIIITQESSRIGDIEIVTETHKIPIEEDGEIVAVLAIIRNITDRQQAEQALRESEEKFRGIFETINDGIHIQEIMPDGKPGKFIVVNETACQMLQYTREELLKHGPLDFVTEYHSRPFDDIIAELSTTGHSIFETGHRRKDGTIVPVEVNSNVVNLQGKKVGVTVIRDITERKRAEDAIRLANRQLTLLTGVTRHDILNKVSMVRGYLKIAEMKSGDPAQAEYLEKTDADITAIKSQIEFTRVYQDLGTHDPQWIGLDTVMPRAHVPKTISLNADIQGVMLFSDPMLEKVFTNLLDNSIRHGEHVTDIRVSSHQSDGNLVVVWEDNGIGVAADEKERIFERGFGKNTGLGLFLVREILALTGITVAETGEPGKGVRFKMTVPKGSYRFANPVKE
jgi:PAS domain S-box-containing protein